MNKTEAAEALQSCLNAVKQAEEDLQKAESPEEILEVAEAYEKTLAEHKDNLRQFRA